MTYLHITRSTIVLVLISQLADCLVLKHSSNCTVETNEGVLDISPLANIDGHPRFTGIKLTHYGEISVNWNPCFDYSEPTGTVCSDVAACVLVQYGPLVHRSLGSNTDSVFGIYELSNNERNEWQDWQADRLYLRYQAKAADVDGQTMNLILDIFFECDPEIEGEVIPKISDSYRLAMILKSRHACWTHQETGVSNFNWWKNFCNFLNWLGELIYEAISPL